MLFLVVVVTMATLTIGAALAVLWPVFCLRPGSSVVVVAQGWAAVLCPTHKTLLFLLRQTGGTVVCVAPHRTGGVRGAAAAAQGAQDRAGTGVQGQGGGVGFSGPGGGAVRLLDKAHKENALVRCVLDLLWGHGDITKVESILGKQEDIMFGCSANGLMYVLISSVWWPYRGTLTT